MEEKLKSFERLLNIMDELREKCPWDKKQTFESLRKLSIEEVYELADAIVKKDYDEIKKEAGDLLLHIVFYAKLGDEMGKFDIQSMIDALCDKLVYRHPHVFGDGEAQDEEVVKKNWEALKMKEKGREEKSILQGVPDALPAMVKANRIQAKVKAVGFDWEEKVQVWDKVHEELEELKTEAESGDMERFEKEFGDLFFSLINTARLYKIDPEAALEKTNIKFKKRFEYLESKTIRKGKSLHDMSLDEMNILWEEAKKYDTSSDK